MITLSRTLRAAALAALTAGVLLTGPAAVGAPAAAQHGHRSVGDVCYTGLPVQAHDTLHLIDRGGPFPYARDGIVFANHEGVLPQEPSGYYHEYTVTTPGAPTRGTRRIITGRAPHEDYYTADHYATFDRVDWTC
ncbi:ribonuclease domain-containing protein [Kitasatospora sp. NPDC058965]|uniref:ribonuclease domain-containing protein n=1 Tax=Kitasatospora sp. NPDC058965 TaxID=3346682 RepID=UPI0036BA6CDB